MSHRAGIVYSGNLQSVVHEASGEAHGLVAAYVCIAPLTEHVHEPLVLEQFIA